jgi:hypothetical protein
MFDRNYSIAMTMEMLLTEAPLSLIGSIEIRCRILDINMVNQGNMESNFKTSQELHKRGEIRIE